MFKALIPLDEGRVVGLEKDTSVEKVDFFFEDGTPDTKVSKHFELANKIGLKVKNCYRHIPKEQIKSMIEYTKKANGVILKSED